MGNSVMLNGVEYAGEQIAYKDSTYELVSKVAYLIGVPLRIFQNEHEPPKIEIYDRLEQDKNARIIRNLCIIRTAIERNYRKINDIMRMEYRGLLSMPEILPMSSMQQLSNDGISFIKKSSTKLCHHIIEINRLISDRINNCKSLFPIWINWAYIKELFIMPNGLTEDGTKDAADIYYASLSYYPYQMYINWIPMDEGNVLYNDKKFATLLYQWHCDAFTEYSKVSDAGAFVKNNIYDFIDDSEKTVLVVDCENSDPYKLCATLKNCALPGFVDSKNEEKTERNAGYLVVSHSGGGMLRQGTRKGIRRTPANRGMRAHRIVKSLDISEDVCHGLCP